MTVNQIVYGIMMLIVTTLLGVIAYFVKRTVSQVDSHEAQISEIKDKYATKEEIDCLQDNLRDDVRKLSDGIESLKDNYIRKDDFVRSIADINRKQERIYDILLEMKGEKANG